MLALSLQEENWYICLLVTVVCFNLNSLSTMYMYKMYKPAECACAQYYCVNSVVVITSGANKHRCVASLVHHDPVITSVWYCITGRYLSITSCMEKSQALG